MNPLMKVYTPLNFLFVLIAFAIPAQSQQQPAQPSQAQLLEAAREIMAVSRYCALITIDSTGHARARTVDPFPPDENMMVWVGTNPRSRKVAEIRRNPRVTLYYFDREGQGYVTIFGIARLVNDPAEKAKRWKEEWKAFYPDRARDYLLIAVTPEKLEVISEKRKIQGDPNTWTPPSVSFRVPKSKANSSAQVESLNADNRLANTEWRLASFGAARAQSPLIQGTTITLKFGSDGRAGGSSGCNTYGADYRVRGNTLSFGAIISTKRACLDQRANQQEQQYFRVLESANGFTLSGNRLTIFNDARANSLNFVSDSR
jgi:heat shock protein HslJ/general stress protein 26